MMSAVGERFRKVGTERNGGFERLVRISGAADLIRLPDASCSGKARQGAGFIVNRKEHAELRVALAVTKEPHYLALIYDVLGGVYDTCHRFLADGIFRFIICIGDGPDAGQLLGRHEEELVNLLVGRHGFKDGLRGVRIFLGNRRYRRHGRCRRRRRSRAQSGRRRIGRYRTGSRCRGRRRNRRRSIGRRYGRSGLGAGYGIPVGAAAAANPRDCKQSDNHNEGYN